MLPWGQAAPGHAGPSDLYRPVYDVPRRDRIKVTSSTPFIPDYVRQNVTRLADAAHAYASRVHGRQLLLENPPREGRAKREQEARKATRAAAAARRNLGVHPKRERTQKGIWKLKPEETRYELFLPLHSLWMGYMSELLSLSPPPERPSAADMPGAAGMHAKLIKADFHGSIVTVRQSKNPCLVGLSGIVIYETENTFKVITSENELKMLPKQNTVFAFAVPLYSVAAPSPETSGPKEAVRTILDIPHIEFELYGNHFRFRAAERAGRKFKHKETIEL